MSDEVDFVRLLDEMARTRKEHEKSPDDHPVDDIDGHLRLGHGWTDVDIAQHRSAHAELGGGDPFDDWLRGAHQAEHDENRPPPVLTPDEQAAKDRILTTVREHLARTRENP
jgi:hypothetical protein